jgi:mRNA interferase MazF
LIRRGELWWADLGKPRGSAPAHRHPVVIVQADSYNRSTLQTVVVAGVTTNLRLAAMPGNVFVAASAGGLEEDSVVDVTQIVAVDERFLDDRIGALPHHLLADVDRGLRRVLNL